MRDIVESYPLRFTLDRRWVAGNVIGGAVRCIPAAGGCVVPLTWPDEQHAGGDVLTTRAKQSTALRGRHVVAVAPPREVEATILLAPMWDASLAGGDADNYSRSASVDFPRYRNVYRLWATNFDGRYVEAGDPRGSAEVDLAALFGEAELNASGVRLANCLALDDNGQPREPVMQYSDDLGLSWSTYPGRVIARLAAGAIYLDDDELAPDYRAAALADMVLLQATFTLVHPQAWTTQRWSGDTLRACAELREERADCFLWREMSAGSIHAEAVAAGELASNAVDDSAALGRWLVDRAATATQALSWQIELADAWPLLKPGDQLLDAGSPGRWIESLAQAVHRAGAAVSSIRCVWLDGSRPGTVAPRTVVLCGL